MCKGKSQLATVKGGERAGKGYELKDLGKTGMDIWRRGYPRRSVFKKLRLLGRGIMMRRRNPVEGRATAI